MHSSEGLSTFIFLCNYQHSPFLNSLHLAKLKTVPIKNGKWIIFIQNFERNYTKYNMIILAVIFITLIYSFKFYS